jgi:hypothetical protein
LGSTGGSAVKYGRLSRHFSFDADDRDASHLSPECYVTLARRRRGAAEPSVVDKYFSAPLSRQGSFVTSRTSPARTLSVSSSRASVVDGAN